MFFKTVRHDGKSIYARGPLCRTYEIGKRYRFPKSRPAHVFLGDMNPDGSFNFDQTYTCRAESSGGNRVLICYGEVKRQMVPCFDIYSDVWDFTNYVSIDDRMEHKNTCADFVVIGEIPLPAFMNGVRPNENCRKGDKVILPGQFQKKS